MIGGDVTVGIVRRYWLVIISEVTGSTWRGYGGDDGNDDSDDHDHVVLVMFTSKFNQAMFLKKYVYIFKFIT